MGGALLSGWHCARKQLNLQTISVLDPGLDQHCPKLQGVHYTAALEEITVEPTVVVFAVKPQQFDVVARPIVDKLGNRPLYISIAAGKTLTALASVLGGDARIVRTMPNSPAVIGQGVTGVCLNEHTSQEDNTLVNIMFSTVGVCAYVDESQMDALTALSGSGPAYVFYFMECLISAAQEMGIDRNTATTLAVHMVNGAAKYAATSNNTLTELREQVTSPHGTTEAALNVLMGGQFKDLITRAMNAARLRAGELSN